MDDNRMLTLASNERIPLLPHMRMVFEIRDLKHATPATVSRAGILYISTDDGNQWTSLIRSWLVNKTNNKDKERKGEVTPDDATDRGVAPAAAHDYSDEIVSALRGYFDKYVDNALMWLLLNAKSIVPVEGVTRVETLLNMLDGCLNGVNTASPAALEVVFVYCAVWALGSSLSVSDDGTDYRKLFSDWWRDSCSDSVKFPPRDTVFDYWLNPETNAFDSWTKSPFFYSVDYNSQTTPMSQVTVPTPETCSVSYWMDLLVKMKKPVMLAGPTGTGKSALVNGMLSALSGGNGDDGPSGLCISACTITFNYYTTSSVLASAMSLPLEKKTGSNYGPPGTGRLVYFVDDMNLPEVDQYNTQSAIAHLRQHLEYEHCFELDKMSLKNIMNTQVVACMNPAAGSNQINPRLQRHFATFFVGLPGSTSLLTIYQSFLNGHFRCLPFADEFKQQSTSVLKAAMGLHAMVTGAFKKTAVNFFYEFTMREISQVFQGLLVSTPDTVSTPDKLVLLWLHESERVYGDRLVSASDLMKYNSLVQSQCKKIFPSFPMARYYSKENAEPLVFSHFADSIERPVYNQVTSLADMNKTLDAALSEYNETNAAMDLVLFEDAMKHVARIVRIIRNESGHALLVGVGGSGKQSLARLAAFICGYSVAQIVISSTYGMSDFKDDLKIMFRKAGLKEEGVLFLMTDGQVFDERCLVCINSLLATGDIDGLFAADEADEIVNGVANRVKAAGMVPDKENCWSYFLRNIRKNLHVCLCFSPVGDDFRTRALRFPALVNCTVMDIFHSWPREALYSVGKKFLRNLDLGSDAERDVIERFLPFSFEAVNKAAIDFQLQEKRHVYTTPKSYLELIKLYSSLLEEKRSDSASAIERLDNGLTKLRQTSESVAKLEEDLKVMLEDAAAKKEKAEGIAEVVAKEKASVEVESAHAQAESEEVVKIQKEVSQKQRDTEEDLAKAEPAVEAAMSALDTLDQKDLSSCKGMLKPPPKLDEVFAATMCLLAGIMPSVITKKSGGQVKVKDCSWDAAKKQLMGNIREYMTYLKEIKTHVDSNTINHNNFKEVRQYIEKDYFNVETMRTKNQAAAGLCSFVINIVEYYDIVTTVEPKRQALREANEQLAEANSKLKTVTEHVAELRSKLATLTADLEEANASKQEAMDAVDRGERKLNLAQRLTTALSSENERWGENVETFRKNSKLLTGDVLLASAFLSYAGPFNKPFRQHLMENVFKPFLLQGFRDAATKSAGAGGVNVDSHGSDVGGNSNGSVAKSTGTAIPMSDDADLLRILTSEAEIAQWNADSLPADVVSSENGSIVCNASRWPLLIDPQLQGIRWLKQKESAPERNMQIVRLGQKDMIRKLEAALENGHTIIIENIGESIDAVLNPVIQRATIKRGSRYFIKVGDKECDFHPDFRLYLHTKLSNPHYPPEIQAETSVVNFTVTMSGLEDQLLNLVVEKERPDLAATSAELISKLNGFTITMKELEDSILQKLASAQGDITEDVELIEGLEETKRISNDIEHQSVLAKQTQTDIVRTSERYRTVANRSSLLFFLMNDLSKIHTYYIFSLDAFQQVFFRAIDMVSDGCPNTPGTTDDGVAEQLNRKQKKEEEEEKQVEARCECLKDSITLTLFNYVRRGLFESDKLTVLTSLGLKILVNDMKLDPHEAQYLLQSKTVADPGNMGPLKEWLPESLWPKIKALEGLDCFAGLGDGMQSDSDDWSAWINAEDAENAKLPGSYEKDLTTFQKLILLRTLRPDRLPICMQSFIGDTMGKQYVSQEPFNMKATYDETNNRTPIFFVLFAGVDPTPLVENLGRQMGFSIDNNRLVNISMGQGQEAPAEAILKKYAKEGGWVMLQNCHLMSSWVPKLERLLEVISEDAHEDFRCFLSAEPPPLPSMHNMPESLMQSCIKVANEAPSDIRSNLIRAWDNFGQDTIDSCTKPSEMKACLFSLCWFHAVVCGRRRFGQQGWSRKYSFNTGDLLICANVLRSYLDANGKVPWDDLRYIFGEIMYGGHVTDAWDRRILKEYLEVYLCPKLIVDTDAAAGDDRLELGPGFKSPPPSDMNYSDYIRHIDVSLPPESPSLFGLHSNAEIKALSDGTDSLFVNIQAMGGIGNNATTATTTVTAFPSSSTTSTSDIVRESMRDLLDRLPANFEMVALSLKAKPLLEGDDGPYIVVALQECGRMNDLLSEMRRSLDDLHKGLEGQKNFSEEMSQLSSALSRNSWPSSWSKLSWPSEKSLSDNFQDLLNRCEQLSKWVVGGEHREGRDNFQRLDTIWLGGLFNPNSYLTAMRQIESRKLNVPLDRMAIHASIVGKTGNGDEREDGGILATNLFLEGASVDVQDCKLVEAKPRELLAPMPLVRFQAVPMDEVTNDPNMYEIPIYYISTRGPQFLLSVQLPTMPDFSKTAATLAGAAVFLT
jgi:dynein heavy chain